MTRDILAEILFPKVFKKINTLLSTRDGKFHLMTSKKHTRSHGVLQVPVFSTQKGWKQFIPLLCGLSLKKNAIKNIKFLLGIFNYLFKKAHMRKHLRSLIIYVLLSINLFLFLILSNKKISCIDEVVLRLLQDQLLTTTAETSQ